jgi:hypothetical protein
MRFLQLEDTCDSSLGLVPAICVWLTPCVCYSLWPVAILPGALARATGRLRMNAAGAKMLPAFPIAILNPLSFLLEM